MNFAREIRLRLAFSDTHSPRSHHSNCTVSPSPTNEKQRKKEKPNNIIYAYIYIYIIYTGMLSALPRKNGGFPLVWSKWQCLQWTTCTLPPQTTLQHGLKRSARLAGMRCNVPLRKQSRQPAQRKPANSQLDCKEECKCTWAETRCQELLSIIINMSGRQNPEAT